MFCIYCRRRGQAQSEEHIIPIGLIGTEDVVASGEGQATTARFTLSNGEVCKECNESLSVLDGRLQGAMGLLRVFWNHVGTRNGLPASAVRPGLHAIRTDSGPLIAINNERRPVTTETGVVVEPSKGQPGAIHSVRLEVGADGQAHSASFVQPILISKKVIRALHKIAFEALCFHRGPEKLIDSRYDGLRRYILKGSGSRSVGIPRDLLAVPTDYVMRPPTVTIQRIRYAFDYMAEIQMAIPFKIDLTPDQSVNWEPSVVRVSDKQGFELRLRSTLATASA